MARARAEPSAGSVLVPSSSRSTRLFPVACAIMRTMLPMCQLKVESVCSMLCSSPMSAKTPSKSGSWLSVAAGMGRPACAIRLKKPDGLERHRLAAGIGAGDYHRGEVFAQLQRERHGFIAEERVAGVHQLDIVDFLFAAGGVADNLGSTALMLRGVPGLGQNKVELGGQLDAAGDIVGVGAHLGA